MSSHTVLPAPGDVVELDFFQIVERSLTLAKSARPDLDWDSKAALERLLIEGSAALASKVVALTNNQGREHLFGTSYLRQSVFRQIKRTGYRPATPTAGTTSVTFTVVSGALAAPVVIPVGTTVRTGDVQSPVVFQLLEEVTILPGGSPEEADGTVENSANATIVFESNGKPYQSVRLPIAPYLDESIAVSTGVDTWSEKRNLLLSLSDDRHFWVEIDAADRAIVHFGDNTNGAVPTGLVTITYKHGGGRVGNVAPGAISLLDGTYTDTLGNPVQIAVTNAERVDTGDERESTASIKLRAPLAMQTPRVSVSRSDYETTATGVPGVARALLLTRNEDEAVPRNRGFLFIVPNNGETPSQELLDEVAERFEDDVTVGDPTIVMPPIGDRPKTVTFQLEVRAPTYVEVNVTARIWLRQGAVSSRVRQAVEDALEDFFAIEVDAQTVDPTLPPGLIPNPRIDFGARLVDASGQPTDSLAFSDLYNVVRDVVGVLKIDDAPGAFLLNGEAQDVTLGRPEFPRLGTVALINAKTNQQI